MIPNGPLGSIITFMYSLKILCFYTYLCIYAYIYVCMYVVSFIIILTTQEFPYLQGAGTAIRPHLSDLICCMLESLSSLEDQGLNYVEVG